MRVAIIGSGGIGRGYLAYLSMRGHQTVLWSPRGTAAADFAGTASLAATGKVEGLVPIAIAQSCAEAVAAADVVVVTVQANGFRSVFDVLAPHLRDGQAVIISSHCSFAALYLHRLLKRRGLAIPIIGWATTALTARKSGPRGVHISGIRARLDVATLPVLHGEAGLALCQALFGDRFQLRDDMLAIMLSNLNPPAHMANMLGNLTRAERGEDWPNYGSITPAVGRIVEALDVERLALAKAFGLAVRSVQEHYALSFGVEPGPVGAMAAAVYRQRPELLGPKTLDTRFITEDVPFGLVPLEFLGSLCGVSLPVHQAGIALFDAICVRDFRTENDLLSGLDIGGLSPAELHEALRAG